MLVHHSAGLHCDRVRAALATRVNDFESIDVIDRIGWDELLQKARHWLGL